MNSPAWRLIEFANENLIPNGLKTDEVNIIQIQ